MLGNSSPKGSSSMVKLLLLESRSVKLKDMLKKWGMNEEGWCFRCCCCWVWKWREKREEVMHFIYACYGMHTTHVFGSYYFWLSSQRLTFDRGKKSTSKMGQGLLVWLDSATYHNYYTTLPKWRLKHAEEIEPAVTLLHLRALDESWPLI